MLPLSLSLFLSQCGANGGWDRFWKRRVVACRKVKVLGRLVRYVDGSRVSRCSRRLGVMHVRCGAIKGLSNRSSDFRYAASSAIELWREPFREDTGLKVDGGSSNSA